MTKAEIDKKRERAKMYYMEGESQKDIAARVGVSEQTLSKWVTQESWDVKRAGFNITRKELVNKSLMALNLILDRVYESKDIEVLAALPDKLVKCAAAIEKLDKKANIVNAMESFIAFSKWMAARMTYDTQITPELIKTLTKYQDMYINENIKI